MQKLAQLTAVIIAHNEAEKLPACLKSLNFAGEILLVDDLSTDATSEIAKKFGATVIKRKLDNFSAQRHLFKTKKGKYVGEVHEQVKVEGKLGYLQRALEHENYDTISQFLRKLD